MNKYFIQPLLSELRFRIDDSNLHIRADQLRARLRLFPVMVGGQMVLEPLFIWLLWEQAAHLGLLLWWAGMYLLHAVETVTWLRHREELGSVQECRAWNLRFILVTASVGLMWGLVSVWFFPPDLAYQALLICVVLGLVAAAATINPAHPPSLYLYILCLTLPLVFRITMEADATHWSLAAMLILFVVVVLNAGRELSRTFWKSLWQGYQNTSLVGQLTEQKLRAEAASREKSRFLAAASHDLRQPLQALVLFSEALQDVAKEGETKHVAGQIGKSVRALVDMFDELLDVSRLDAGVVEARWQHFELQSLLDRLYVDFSPFAQAKKLVFDIPVCDRVLYSDPYLLERILRNLISNAIRYTDKGSVAVRCHDAGEKLKLEVADTGIGITREALPHIFEEYYQVDNPHRDRRKGLGLGLAIVRRIEGLLGCKVEVESVPGKGSVFSFSVGLGDAAQLTHPFVITHSRHDLNGMVVALVEDDPDIRQVAASLMQQWGCRVTSGEFPEDVMRKMDYAGVRPDLLVCDYRLPQGITAIHAISSMRDLWGSDLPALVLTGDTAPETLHEIHASGAMLLHKPITPARLRSMMYMALHGEN